MPVMSRFTPRDSTATAHYTRVTRVVFSKPDASFLIAECLDGSTVMGAADATAFESGVTYKLLGRWEDDPQRGWRFRFTAHLVHALHSRAAVVKYLCDLCEGIGPKAADKLWTAYGGLAVEQLRDHPYETAGECKLNEEMCLDASESLTRDMRFQATKIDLHGLFQGRGFQGKLIDECLNKWGAKAATVIRANPFRLLDMTSAGFKRCDKLYLDCGCNPSALKRQAICAANLVRTARDGHTWFDAHEIASRLMDLIPGAQPVRAFKLGLRARLLDKHRDETGKLWITTAVRAYCERAIVDHVRRLGAAGESEWPVDRIPVSREDGDKLPSAHQVERLTLAAAGRVGLFIGGPGTGKTHTLAYLLKEVIRTDGAESVAVVAPTGKAALRAGQALKAAGVPVATSTIHSLLIACGAMSLDGADGDDMDGFGGVEGMLDCKWLVVDESSMIDTNLMAVLLAAVPTGCHVLFVGDPYQLPPVGHGSPLRDLIAASLPCGELTQVRRNAGQIVHACLRIKNGEDFETTDRIDQDAEPPRNLRLIHAKDEAAQADMLSMALGGMKAFHPVWGCQVIVARNKGGQVTRRPLNERLQALLNPEGYTVTGNPFRVGDKVICLKNSKQQVVDFDGSQDETDPAIVRDPRSYLTRYSVDHDTGHREPVQVKVMNGEIGRVVAVGASQMVVRFSERDELIRVPMGKSDKSEEKEDDDNGRGCNFDLGYAVTCHKLQGSEAPCVIVMADAQGGGVATREWWYTAVSRAAKVCLIVGSRAVVDKQRVRVSMTRRKTFLAEQLTAPAPELTDGDCRIGFYDLQSVEVMASAGSRPSPSTSGKPNLMARARRTATTTAPAVAVAPFTVVIDTREQLPWAFDTIPADAHQGGAGAGYIVVPKVVETLGAGDYSIVGYETRVAVERKSLADCFSTIGQGRDRFERELARLAGMDFAAVIVEEELSTILTNPPAYSQLSPKTITRSVQAWQQRYPRVHWMFLPGRRAGMLWGYRVLERYHKERMKEAEAK